MDDDAVAARLRLARARAGYGNATEASAALGVPYGTYSGHENGGRGIPADKLIDYARRYKVSLEWLMTGRDTGVPRQIPLKRYVGAGQAIYPFDDGGDDYIEAPPDLNSEAIAAVIRGDSMYPRYDDGNIIMWSRHVPPTELLNQEAAIGSLRVLGSRGAAWACLETDNEGNYLSRHR